MFDFPFHILVISLWLAVSVFAVIISVSTLKMMKRLKITTSLAQPLLWLSFLLLAASGVHAYLEVGIGQPSWGIPHGELTYESLLAVYTVFIAVGVIAYRALLKRMSH